MESFAALVLNIVVLVAFGGVLVYLGVEQRRAQKDTEQSILEIKSKIGSLVRAINDVNRMEYNVDAAQQADINKLKARAML